MVEVNKKSKLLLKGMIVNTKNRGVVSVYHKNEFVGAYTTKEAKALGFVKSTPRKRVSRSPFEKLFRY